MKRTILSASLMLAVAAPGVALAKAPSPSHARAYQRAYTTARHKLGHRAPGRNIVKNGFDNRHGATDSQVVASLDVLHRMLAPPPVVAVSSAATSTGASSGLAACIISHESGGDTQATNGQYTGIAQWSPSSWAGGGGTKYAASPTSATYGQQVAVLNSMLANGQSGQWTPYDGC